MKKIGLWKKVASWLLVFLIGTANSKPNVFAEGWISENDISISVDSVENEDADYNEEEENTDFYSDENIENQKVIVLLIQKSCQRQILLPLVMKPVCLKIQRHRKFRLL